MESEKIELFAIIELFGHQKMAGKVSEQVLGGNFVRIDVPETKNNVSFTRFVHPNAIYAINPVTEEVMLHMAENFQQKPIDSWDLREMNKKLLSLQESNDNENDLDI